MTGLAKEDIVAVMVRLLIVISLLVLLACQGNGGGLTEAGDLPGNTGFAASIQPIFDSNCTRCHFAGGSGYNATGGASGGLDLTDGSSYASLVGQPTFQSPAIPPRWRVLASQPDSSYVVQKIVSASPKQGNQMPLDGPPFVTQSDIDRIIDWITNGAADD